MHSQPKPMEESYIVHVDDDTDDEQWLKESFSLYSSLAVHHFPNANSFLNYINSLLDKKTPCLFVIDLNLPDIPGLELIKKIKTFSSFEKVPILVYTTGYSPADKANCDKMNIELLKKPNSVQEWQSTGKLIALRCNP